MPTKRTLSRVETPAFRRLYDAHNERIRRFLARTVGQQQAEDLTQVVFAKAARGLAKFRGDAQESTWLYRIAANVAADWLRGRPALEAKVTARLPDAVDHAAGAPSAGSDLQADQTSPEQELVRKEMRTCIRRVIEQLPDKHRTVLVLGELEDLSVDEISRTLGISRGNAKVRLHRARVQLKGALEAQCDFSRNEDNEFVCEPKPAACSASPGRSGCSGTIEADARPGSEPL